MALEQSERMAGRLWETNSTVRPRLAERSSDPRHLRWKAASPTASTSSTMSTSGSRCAATANASRTCIPEE